MGFLCFSPFVAATTDLTGGTTYASTSIVPNGLYIEPVTATSSGPLTAFAINVDGFDTQGGHTSGNLRMALYSSFNINTQIASGLIVESESTPASVGLDYIPVSTNIQIVAGTTYFVAVESTGGILIFSSAYGNDYSIGPVAFGTFPDPTSALQSYGIIWNIGLVYGSSSPTPTPTPYPNPTNTPTFNPNPTATPTPVYFGTPTPTTIIQIGGINFSTEDFLVIIAACAIIFGCSAYVAWSYNQGTKRKSRKKH